MRRELAGHLVKLGPGAWESLSRVLFDSLCPRVMTISGGVLNKRKANHEKDIRNWSRGGLARSDKVRSLWSKLVHGNAALKKLGWTSGYIVQCLVR